MKNYIAVAALLAAGTAFANADIVAVFNCGGTGAHGTWMDTSKEGWTSATQDGTTAGSFNVTASGSGITLSSTGSGLLSTDDQGSFTAGNNANVDDGPYEIPTALETLSSKVLGTGDYNTLWGGSINLWEAGSATLTLDGLTANTEYKVYLFSARANAHSNTGSSVTWSTTTDSAEWSAWKVKGNMVGSTSYPTVWFDGDENGKNASIVEVTFTTGAEQNSVSFSTSGAPFTLNGIVVDQGQTIPEPSAFGLLAGLGALALVASRRRRK